MWIFCNITTSTRNDIILWLPHSITKELPPGKCNPSVDHALLEGDHAQMRLCRELSQSPRDLPDVCKLCTMHRLNAIAASSQQAPGGTITAVCSQGQPMLPLLLAHRTSRLWCCYRSKQVTEQTSKLWPCCY